MGAKMNFRFFCQFRPILPALFLFAFPWSLSALDHIEFTQNGQKKKESGRALYRSQETGEIGFETRDGRYLVLSKDELGAFTKDEKPFSYYTKDELIRHLKNEFPAESRYDILVKDHFVLVHTTSDVFADWYGQLLERVYAGFTDFWEKKGITLHEPACPMVALVFSSRHDFFRYAADEGNAVTQNTHAYFNLKTNRIVLCDISGLEASRENEQGRASPRKIAALLQQPGAVENVTMVVHEAVHQIGFNCGLQKRLAPYPLWVSEGLAVFHEVPDRGKQAAWTSRPKVNPIRQAVLIPALQKQRDPLRTLILSDDPFRNAQQQRESYALTWGWTYFLIMKRPKEYVAYLKILAEKDMDSDDSPEIRLRDFTDCFGDDWEKLYKDFSNTIRKL